MEAANAAIAKVISNSNNNVGDADVKQLKVGKSNNKKVNVLKAALLTILGKSCKTTKCIQAEVVADGNNWAMLVGSIRPMTDLNSLMLMPDDAKNEELELEKAEDQNVVAEDEESECESRYASALNLQELDKSVNNVKSEEDDNEDDLFDDTRGDAMIDMKAEMFIAQFYAQVKMDYEHHLYKF